MKIDGNQIKVGNILEINNKLWKVLKTQHTQPGKGGAYLQAELKELKDGTKSFFNQVLAASLGWKKNSDDDISPVTFGNSQEIPLSSIQLISELADSLTLLRKWKDKDILLIDNYRVMHGRKTFSGEKVMEVLVSLTN